MPANVDNMGDTYVPMYRENHHVDGTNVPNMQTTSENSRIAGQMHVAPGDDLPICKEKGKEKLRKKRGNNGEKVKAYWDEYRHKAFVRLCVEQVKKGHKPYHTLNKVGYQELEDEFYGITGCRYHREQLKNHWDATRRDWQAWQALKNETGMGWDNERGTYSQTNDWWKDFGKRYVGGEKFKYHPLALEEELDFIFHGGVATGENKFIPSSGSIPIDESTDDPTNECGSCHEFVDSPQTSIGTSATGPFNVPMGDEYNEQRGSTRRKSMGGKRSRVSAAMRFETFMQQVCDVLVARSKVSVPTEDDDPYSLKNAIQLLNENPLIEPDSNEWWSAIDAFDQPVACCKFILLQSHERRAEWARREYVKSHYNR